MIEEKEWAKELSQSEFDIQFPQRHPYADCIPDINKYLNAEIPKSKGIDHFNLEDMVIEGKVEKEQRKDSVLFCMGCKKEFTHPKSKWANKKVHEKTCKTLLAMKL